jgi:hypothetical protein
MYHFKLTYSSKLSLYYSHVDTSHSVHVTHSFLLISMYFRKEYFSFPLKTSKAICVLNSVFNFGTEFYSRYKSNFSEYYLCLGYLKECLNFSKIIYHNLYCFYLSIRYFRSVIKHIIHNRTLLVQY